MFVPVIKKKLIDARFNNSFILISVFEFDDVLITTKMRKIVSIRYMYRPVFSSRSATKKAKSKQLNR